MNCPNCGRVVYGFWKYGSNNACSKKCFRALIDNGTIPKLFPERGYPELGISSQKENQIINQSVSDYLHK